MKFLLFKKKELVVVKLQPLLNVFQYFFVSKKVPFSLIKSKTYQARLFWVNLVKYIYIKALYILN